MIIQNYIPENALLKQLVECFFIIEHGQKEPAERFLILPSVDTYFSVSVGTATFKENNIVITKAVKTNHFDASLQVGLKTPCIYEYRGRVKEVCIRFKPLGAWSFFYRQLAALPLTFNVPEEQEFFFRRLLKLDDNKAIFSEIEKYLTAHYLPFSHAWLPAVMEELKISDTESKINFDVLAAKYNISRQTLTSQFKKYLSLAPSEFRQIGRFRKFIETKLLDEHHATLTNIVYDTGFFDQSHLVKYFRKYSFLHPLEFFRRINFSDNRKVLLIWQ